MIAQKESIIKALRQYCEDWMNWGDLVALIEARNVTKKYKVGSEIITALDDVTLSIEQGEFVAILGTSGCGKSTLLNMLSGLERPTKGDVIVNGVRINKVNEKNMSKFRSKEMGFIFQQYNLIGSLTALENVMLPLTIQGVGKKARVERSKAILERLGLGSRLNNKPSQMSGGQQQRVSIARSLVSEPKIIFADEPTGNLDSRTTIEILEFLQSIVREQNKTLIMVSHDAEVAMYADRIVHMLDGRITSIEDNRANAVGIKLDSAAADEIEPEKVESIPERGTEVE